MSVGTVDELGSILGRPPWTRAVFELDPDGQYTAFDERHQLGLAARNRRGPQLRRPLSEALVDARGTDVEATATRVELALERARVQGTADLLVEGKRSLAIKLLGIRNADDELVAFLGLHEPERDPNELETRRDEIVRLGDGVLNELNNLGVGLGGATEALRGEPQQGAGVEQLLEDVRGRADVARRLARVIRSAAMPRPTRLIELDPWLTGLEPRLRQLAPRSGLVVDAGAPGAHVRADPDELGDALAELVKNASEASARRIVLRTRPVESRADGTRHITLDIEDDGEGMSEERAAKVFDVYFGSRKHAQGIGLTHARAIVQAHDGRLRLSSRAGAGTTASIDLPALGERASPSTDGGQTSPAAPAHLDVFVVDDAPEVRRVLGRVLRHAGHEVSEAEDGVDALEKLEARGRLPDVVILDLMMPRMDGVETYRALRARTSTLPILITSGYHPSSLGFLASDPRASFLPKPFSPSEVITALDALMSEAEASSR